jgi:pimeloyl-ACP methyl ester carboxylesterase
MPDAPSENHEWFNELQRLTTTPENAARLSRALGDVDVSERLSLVQTPTLVAHATGDLRVPFASGRELAAGIPGARSLQLETRNHLLPEADPEWPRLLDEIRAFLTE